MTEEKSEVPTFQHEIWLLVQMLVTLNLQTTAQGLGSTLILPQWAWTAEDDGSEAEQFGDSSAGGLTGKSSETKQSTSCSARPGRSSRPWALFGHASADLGHEGWLPEATEAGAIKHTCAQGPCTMINWSQWQ